MIFHEKSVQPDVGHRFGIINIIIFKMKLVNDGNEFILNRNNKITGIMEGLVDMLMDHWVMWNSLAWPKSMTISKQAILWALVA